MSAYIQLEFPRTDRALSALGAAAMLLTLAASCSPPSPLPASPPPASSPRDASNRELRAAAASDASDWRAPEQGFREPARKASDEDDDSDDLACSPASVAGDGGAMAATTPPAAAWPPIRFIHPKSQSHVNSSITLPILDFGSPGISKRVNDIIAREAAGLRNGLTDSVEAAVKAGIPAHVEPGDSVQCEVSFASQDLVSVACPGDTWTGGAHPTKTVTTLTLSLPDLKPVTLSQFFQADTRWKDELVRACSRALRRQVGDGNSDSCPDVDSFSVTAEGLKFFFEDSLPFVIGSVHPLVRWESMACYLKSSGIADVVRHASRHSAATSG